MTDVIKETIKKQLSDKSKEELLDMCAGFCADIMQVYYLHGMVMADANTHATTQQAKAVMDAIKGDFQEATKILCGTEKTASPLVNKLRDRGI